MRCRTLLPGSELAAAVPVDGRLLPPAAHAGRSTDGGALPGGLRVHRRYDHRDLQERRVLPARVDHAAALRGRIVVQ